jgi:methanogenic corrinoid protein MtbC1
MQQGRRRQGIAGLHEENTVSALSSNASAADDSGRMGQVGDCWEEMQALSAHQGHAVWATLASQRPAVEERLTRLVQTIEKDIIPRLVRAHPNDCATRAPVDTTTRPGAADVESFTQQVMARDDPAIQATLAFWRGIGVSVETIFLDLLAPAARHLGELWEDDRCHFADVTVGLGRLQQIMRSLNAAFGTDIEPPAGGRRVLLLPAPGDQHTFGLSMVAEFFARAGWEVVGVIDALPVSVQDKVKYEWFDLVGISAGSTTRVEAMKSCIASVRRHSHNRSVAVMVGGPLFLNHSEMVSAVDADGMSTDARTAPAVAEQLISRRLKGS